MNATAAALRNCIVSSLVAVVAAALGGCAAQPVDHTGSSEEALCSVSGGCTSGGSSGGGDNGPTCDGYMPADPASCFTGATCSVHTASVKYNVAQPANLASCSLGVQEVWYNAATGTTCNQTMYVCTAGTPVPSGDYYSTTYCDNYVGTPDSGDFTVIIGGCPNVGPMCPGGCSLHQ